MDQARWNAEEEATKSEAWKTSLSSSRGSFSRAPPRTSLSASMSGIIQPCTEFVTRSIPSVLTWTAQKGFFFFDAHSHSFFRVEHGYISRLTRPPNSNVFGSFDSVSASGMAYFEPQNCLIFCDPSFHILRSISLDKNSYGTMSTFAGRSTHKRMVEGHKNGKLNKAQFSSPFDVVVSPWDDIVISDSGNHVIRIVKEGKVKDLAGRAEKKGFRDGPKALAMFDRPLGMTISIHGEVYVCDNGNRRVRMIEAAEGGVVKTIAGSGEDGLSDGEHLTASLGNPTRIKITSRGDLICLSHNLRMIQERGGVSTLWSVSKPYSISSCVVSSISRRKKSLSRRFKDVLNMKVLNKPSSSSVAVPRTSMEQFTIPPAPHGHSSSSKRESEATHSHEHASSHNDDDISISEHGPPISSDPVDDVDYDTMDLSYSESDLDELDWHPSDMDMPREICDFFIDANGDLFYTDLGSHFNFLQLFGNLQNNNNSSGKSSSKGHHASSKSAPSNLAPSTTSGTDTRSKNDNIDVATDSSDITAEDRSDATKKRKEKILVVRPSAPTSADRSSSPPSTSSKNPKNTDNTPKGPSTSNSPRQWTSSSPPLLRPSVSNSPPPPYECAKIKVIKGANALIYPLRREIEKRYRDRNARWASFVPGPLIRQGSVPSSVDTTIAVDTTLPPIAESTSLKDDKRPSSIERSLSSSVLVPRDHVKGDDYDLSILLSPGNPFSDYTLTLPIAEGGTETWRLHSLIVFLACPPLLSLRTVDTIKLRKFPSDVINALIEYIYGGILPSTRRQGPLFWALFAILAHLVSLDLVRQYACLRLYQSLILYDSLAVSLKCIAESEDAKFVFEAVCNFLARYLPLEVAQYPSKVKSRVFSTINREELYDVRQKAATSLLEPPPLMLPKIDPASKLPTTPDLHHKDNGSETDDEAPVLKINPAVPMLASSSLTDPSTIAIRISMLARRFRGSSPLHKWNRVDPFGVIQEEVLTLGAWLTSASAHPYSTSSTSLLSSSSAPSSSSSSNTNVVPFPRILQPDWYLRVGSRKEYVPCHSCILYARWPWFRAEIEKMRSSALSASSSFKSSNPLSATASAALSSPSIAADSKLATSPQTSKPIERLPFSPPPFAPYVSPHSTNAHGIRVPPSTTDSSHSSKNKRKKKGKKKDNSSTAPDAHPPHSSASGQPSSDAINTSSSQTLVSRDEIQHMDLQDESSPSYEIDFPHSKAYKRSHSTQLPDDPTLTYAYVEGLVWYLYSGEVTKMPKGAPLSADLFASLGFVAEDSKAIQDRRDRVGRQADERRKERLARRRHLNSLNCSSSASEFESSSGSDYDTTPGTFFDALKEHNSELVERPLTVDNAIPALLFARQHAYHDRYSECVAFLGENLGELLGRPELRREFHTLPEAEYSSIIQLSTVSPPPHTAHPVRQSQQPAHRSNTGAGQESEEAQIDEQRFEAPKRPRRRTAPPTHASSPRNRPSSPPSSHNSPLHRSNTGPVIVKEGIHRVSFDSGRENEVRSIPPRGPSFDEGDALPSSSAIDSSPSNLASTPSSRQLRSAQEFSREDFELNDTAPVGSPKDDAFDGSSAELSHSPKLPTGRKGSSNREHSSTKPSRRTYEYVDGVYEIPP